jgi:3-mercaptopyruvate sulfurtransferase SseA
VSNKVISSPVIHMVRRKMSVLDYFKPVSTWPAEKIREFLGQKESGEYNLVDVRQPSEYEQGHLPGAQLIPAGELPNRLAELDHNKPTIVY